AVDQLLGTLRDFIGRSSMNVLLVSADQGRQREILKSMDCPNVEVVAAADGRAAVGLLRERHFECLVLDGDEVAAGPEALLTELDREPAVACPPVIVYESCRPTDRDEAARKRLGRTCAVRGVHSAERLQDQIAFFLHQNIAKLPEARRQLLQGLHESDEVLAGKRVLIVDDDIRNIFALSTVLEEHEMVIVAAETGRDAIRILNTQPDIDIVLMDIMMPEMDGIDTMREIRKVPKLKALPIIAVTAKAMKGDREKCIEAGAWDYLSKPVETEQMLAVLRAWLHR
ncbi:MAG: response regulator, partial [Planctomycetia bacterium]|nr:response regulator [Planctomycetia bacterium]